MQTAGARALVTGGARRIGRAICLGLADAGATVAVHYRTSEAEAREVAGRCGGPALQADLGRVDEAESLVERAADALGGIDILVNSAAVWDRVALDDLTEEVWDRNLDTNLKHLIDKA